MEQNRKTVRMRHSAQKNMLSYTGAVFAALALLLICLVAVHVHPGTSFTAEAAAQSGRFNLSSEITAWSGEAKKAVMAKFVSSPFGTGKAPAILLNAPAPLPSAYRDTYTPSDALDIIEDARSSGLLGMEEDVVFSTGADFLLNTPVRTYRDDTILVLCWKEYIDGRVCSCCEIKIADASQMRRKLSQDVYGSYIKAYATELAAESNAVVAMNADYYLPRDLGVTVYNRDLYRFNEWTYLGKYRSYNCIDTLLINSSGDFRFLRMGEECSREQLKALLEQQDILFSIAFGPVLVENGKMVSHDWYPLGEINDRYSRAGFAQCGPLHYFYMTVSHSEKNTPVCTINEFAEIMASKKVQYAYAFDGGQTGELVFAGEPYNHIDFGSERTVSDILCFTSAVVPAKGRSGQ